jgi:LemA protein
MAFAFISLGWGIFIGAVILLAIIVIWAFNTVNRLRKYDKQAQEAESGINLALAKVHDFLAKWIENLQKFTPKETENLVKSVEFTLKIQDNAAISDKEAFQEKLCQTESELKVLTEKQTEPAVSEFFREIQIEMSNVDEHLQVARRFYNATVTQLNFLVSHFPQSLVANAIAIDKRPFFEIGEKV